MVLIIGYMFSSFPRFSLSRHVNAVLKKLAHGVIRDAPFAADLVSTKTALAESPVDAQHRDREACGHFIRRSQTRLARSGTTPCAHRGCRSAFTGRASRGARFPRRMFKGHRASSSSALDWRR